LARQAQQARSDQWGHLALKGSLGLRDLPEHRERLVRLGPPAQQDFRVLPEPPACKARQGQPARKARQEFRALQD
jgi:hypothetical protein